MKKTGLYIGIGVGVLVLGAFAYMMFRKKKEDEGSTKSAEADTSVDAEEQAVKDLATTTNTEIQTAATQVASALSDEEQLAALEQQPSTPLNEVKKKRLRKKIEAFKNKLAEDTKVGRLTTAVATQTASAVQQGAQNVQQAVQQGAQAVQQAASAVQQGVQQAVQQGAQTVQQAVQTVVQNIQTRRKCRKEADERFGFPIRPKKIKEKRDFIKACKDAGGEDFAFAFEMDDEQYDMFNY